MPTPQKANMFHSGNTCPFCQETIAEREQVVICPDCGCIQHDLCWNHNKGCASYHCDKNVKSTQPNFSPELVITDGDLDKVIVPPKPVKKTPEEVAKDYLPDTKKRHSFFAVISLIISCLSLVAICGLFTQQIFLYVFSFIFSIIAILLGVIALVKVNMGSKVSGGITASVSISLSCLMILLSAFMLSVITSNDRIERSVDLQLSNLPDEERLNALPESQSNALKANAVITCSTSGVFKEMSYGSGVITRIEDNRAYIMTNKHVINIKETKVDAKNKISVTLYNGESSDAKVEWLAPGTVDIAIISCQIITLKKQKMVKVGSAILAPSHPVFAIGNPMNFFWSYTEGVISSIRKQSLPPYEVEVYQTQTPINQGNSGGGLYTKEGLLVGINTWTLNKSFAEGLNFSISTKSIIELLGEKAKEYISIHEETEEKK